MSNIEKALKKISQHEGSLKDFELVSKELQLQLDDIYVIKEYLTSCGLRNLQNNYLDEVYCVVDIETTGGKPTDSQIIEIGAIKYHKGKIIDTFETLVYASEVPENITNVTNITTQDLINAPKLSEVLQKFRIFLQDSVFVAHNVNFDYGFISNSFALHNLGVMLNPKLCTIDLSRRCFELPKYGLKSMIEYFEMNSENHHRAFFDATVSLRVLQECFLSIPWYVESLDDLIIFSKSKLKKSKTEPIAQIDP